MFVLLCNSDYLTDGHEYQLVEADGDYSINKADIFTVDELVKGIKSGEIQKAATVVKAPATAPAKQFATPEMPTGNSWSAELQRKNFPARWVTVSGSRVLIKLFNQGKKDAHGVVVFAGGASRLEHLKVYPKSSEEYASIKRKAEGRKKKRAQITTSDEVTEEELKAERNVIKQKREEKREVENQFREELLKVADLDEVYNHDDISGNEQALIKRAERVEERENKKALKELAEMEGDLDTRDKDKMAQDLVTKAEKTLVDDELKERLGDEYADVTKGIDEDTGEPIETPTHSNNEAVKKVLSRVKLDKDQALEILRLNEIKKKNERAINNKYKDKLSKPKGNLELTSMQGLIMVDWNEESKSDDLIETALKNELTRIRASMNTDYYKQIQDVETGVNRLNKSTFTKQYDKGSVDTTNILSDIYLDGHGLPSDLVDLIGAENAGRIVAGAVVQKKGRKKALQELEGMMETRAFETVMDSLEVVDRKLKRIADRKGQIEEGVMRAGTINADIGRQSAAINRELGYSLGNLQTLATVADSLRDIKQATGDVVVDGGLHFSELEKKVKDIGLKEGQYAINRSSRVKGRWELTIPYEAYSDLLTARISSGERNAEVAAIKAGERYDPNWLPKGTATESYQVYDKKGLESKKAEWAAEGVLEKKMEGWEQFKNKKGEAGYSSLSPEGTTLYRKKGKTSIFPAPQKMIQMALTQKRAVMNLGAGTGKTVGFLGTVQELKATGKLKTYAFHTMPSRLRDEFFKDRDKFFPDLKVLELDNIKGKNAIERKRQALADAAAGKYDMVISGHDTMKATAGDKEIKAHIEKMTAAYIRENNGGVYRKGTKKERKMLKEKFGKQWTEELKRTTDLPSIIRESNPTIVTVDEAHEAVKDFDKKASQRMAALTTLSKNAEYFIPATGTVVKNDIGELASILHLTRPDLIPNAGQYKRQWNGSNQGTNVFGERAFDALRRSYDEVMLTEHLSLKGIELKKHEGTRLNLTQPQKTKITAIENTYHHEKSMSGVAIMSKNGYELVKDESGEPKKFTPNFSHTQFEDETTGGNSTRANNYIKSMGLDPEKHELVKLGQAGASARRDSRYRKILANGDWKENVKMDAISKNIDKHLANNQRQVVFTNRHDSIATTKKMLEEKYGYKEGVDFVTITGDTKSGTNAGQRNWAVNHFNTNPDCKIMLANEAGMTGLNMQGGTVNHWIERPNAYYKDMQGNARTFRTGQENDVDAYYYDTNTILEDRMYDNLDKKRRYTEAVGETPDKRVSMVNQVIESRKRLNDKYDSGGLTKAAKTPKLVLNV